MLSMDINHPDSLQFIKSKEDLTKVTGANISVRMNQEFMKAVENDEDYILRFPCGEINFKAENFKDSPYNILEELDGGPGIGLDGYTKKIKAKEYFNEIVKQARNNAEPGILFWDNILNYSPDGVYEQHKAISTNPCFSYDTKILTAEGYKKIGSLEGEELDFINYKGEIVQGTVFESGSKPIYKMKLSNGEIIETTINHEFMLTDGSRKEAQFIKGERIMPFYKINNEVNIFTNYGFIQGDGSLGRLDSIRHLGMEVHIGENDEDICELFNVKNTGKHYLRGYNEILRELKFDSSSLPTRTLPLTFSDWEDKNKLMFLKGLWSANGSVIKNHRVSFKSTSKDLIEELVNVLNYFDIKSYYTTNKAKEIKFKNGTYECKESYDLNISRYNSVLKFAELISFVHSYKRDSLEDLIKVKAPKVIKATVEKVQKVYDFSLQDNTHWGVIQGVIAHNCGEIPMGAYDSCRLMCLNLFSFVDNPFTDKAEINFKKLYEISYEQQRLMDDLVDLEIESIEKIITKIQNDSEPIETKQTELNLWVKILDTAKKGRRTGSGITALADMLAALGIKYDSQEALDITKKVMKTKMEGELDCSIDLAILRGPFESWDVNKEFKTEIVKGEISIFTGGKNEFYQFIFDIFPEQAKRMQKYSRRNISWSTVAPTGSVSIMAKLITSCNSSSGCEPVFMPYYMRRKKINPNDKDVRVDFVDDNGDSWQEFPILMGGFKDWYIIEARSEHCPEIAMQALERASSQDMKKIYEQSPWYKSTANDISWEYRLKMQEVLQNYTSHSISSTLNLPEDTTEETVSNIYLTASKMNLKGVTVYREGSRSGVLIDSSKQAKTKFNQNDAVKRPKILDAIVKTTSVKSTKYNVFIGLLDGKPYEVFCSKGNLNTEGTIIKEDKGVYRFNSKDQKYSIIITFDMSDEEAALTRLLSTSLRHGAKIDFIVEQLNKTNGDLTSFSKAISRVLSKFVETKEVGNCPECETGKIMRTEGCEKCTENCGYSKC